MDEKTAELRDIFVETTGSESVTERQEESPGSLTDAPDDEERNRRVAELVAAMRERYEFESDLSGEDLRRVVRGFFDGDADAELAAVLEANADKADVFVARTDLHLLRESDADAPFSLDALRSLLDDGADDEACAAALDADAETVARARRVVEARREATRANDRFRGEFEELLTDSDLSARLAEDARRDGLREATEDIETDVSL
ncbi:conditioned medium-induced protein 4 [Halogeometricum sp. S1BR25-6]|uniref:Conditioned medium-induced protein 4 n=1 Tax=Halogeometricum salsisoli TaxID=2950536 RepID=A0ABU2GB18_9EURY|nr:conditioned medium-induced protein 4 [Halogeometricum sp. S1BR25-6]MDS0297463.1 conditioned medium-induced protein 4 [Halogeometricum sp. S1BR25-6]